MVAHFAEFSAGWQVIGLSKSRLEKCSLRTLDSATEREMLFSDGSEVLGSLKDAATDSEARDRHFTFDPGQVTVAAFSPRNDSVLAVGDGAGVVRIGDIHTGKTTTAFI